MQPVDSAAAYSVSPEAVTFDLRSDVGRVLSQLDTADRRVAIALMEYSPMEASRRLGVARSTIYCHIGTLRTAFTKAGLGGLGGSTRCCGLLPEP
jgi:hypothetical protein